MRKIVMVVIVCLGFSTFSTVAQNLLDGPETIVYDEAHNRYLVSNLLSGSIVQIDKYGSYSFFYTGVTSNSYGLHIIGDTLLVASNFSSSHQGVVMLDLNTADYLGIIKPTGMQFANDITSDSLGNIYVTDTYVGAVFEIRRSDGMSSVLAGLSPPNGIHYDSINDRLLVAINSYAPIVAVDPTTGEVTIVSTFYSVFDGFDQDQRQNLYASDSDLGTVFRFDSTLTGDPVVISTGHDTPEGIHFNILHSTLAIPNLFGHTIDFMPLDVDLWSSFDTTFGWAPLEASLSAESVYDVAEWIWDFGDGDTAFGPSPAHIYEDGGYYDVTLCAVTVAGDSIRRVYPGHILVLADSLWAEDVEVGASGLLELVVSCTNNVPLQEIRFPVGYSGGMDLVYDSFSTSGCRSDFFVSQEEIGLDESNQHVSFRLRTRPGGSPLFLPPGSGPILKAYFHLGDNPISQEMDISFAPLGAHYSPEFITSSRTYVPELSPCTVAMSGCCGVYTGGFTGNANCSDDGKLTLSDITRLIDRVYISNDPLCCEAAGNTNASVDCKITLSDITVLIDAVYVSNAQPADCMPECET